MTVPPATTYDDPGYVRRLSPAEKLSIAHGLREMAWQLSAAGVRLRHPEWSEQQVQDDVREIFLRAATT